MERWYIAFSTYGAPHEILDRLVRAVRQYQLGDFVIRFCYEKGVKKGQFYVFIGVVSEVKGNIPYNLYNNFYAMLKQLKLRDSKLYVYFDEVKTMVTQELEIHNLREIKMWRPEKLSPSDPFSYLSRDDIKPANEDQIDAYNKLLYWLSIHGRGSWQQFHTACKTLGLDSTGDQSRRIIRRLRLLGHVELSKNGQNWFITPPSLVATEQEPNAHFTVFLAGQRSSKLIQELDKFGHVDIEPQPDGDAPDAIRAIFSDQDSVQNFVDTFSKQYHQLYFKGFASFEIASVLPILTNWQDQLVTLSLVKGNYKYEQWLNDEFQPVHLPKETGLYRLTHVSDRFKHPQMTLFYDADKDHWYRGDWYGLRYLTLRRNGISCEFNYDHNLKRLSIPLKNRLPDMYERAIVLASGRLPVSRNQQLIFGDVPETLAHVIANKLEAEFVEYRGI